MMSLLGLQPSRLLIIISHSPIVKKIKSFKQKILIFQIVLKRIYTTFILGTALLNFDTRANNMGHGTLNFCRVKANFSARVPKNLGGPRPRPEVVSARLKRGPRAGTRGILVPRVFALYTFREKKDGLEE